jgi:hypothetical protein
MSLINIICFKNIYLYGTYVLNKSRVIQMGHGEPKNSTMHFIPVAHDANERKPGLECYLIVSSKARLSKVTCVLKMSCV